MPPRFKFTKDEIIKSALDVVRENGISGLTARALAAKLGCSVKPIFGLFQNMEEVQQKVLLAANTIYQDYLQKDMTSGKYPSYKASGIAYIRFAKEEKELFKLLFMRDRTYEKINKDKKENKEEIKPLIQLIQKNIGLNEDNAYQFHIEMWLYVHGIATMIATSYLDWDMEFINTALTDMYIGLKYRYCGEEKGGENNNGKNENSGYKGYNGCNQNSKTNQKI